MSETKSPLERMQERIYATSDPESATVPDYSENNQQEVYGWEAPPPPPPPKPSMPWAVRFLIAAGAFFVVVGIAAVVYLYLGGRSISSDRIDISVAGLPSTIASGDSIPLVVTVKNNNPTEIREARLLVSFPPGTKRADGSAEMLEQYPEILGSLAPGAEATRTVSVQLFGAQDQILAIPIRVEYRTEGSNALFVSEEEVTVTVGTSPLSVQVSSIGEVAAGQPVTVTATVRSNATAVIEDAALTTNFREIGFVLSSSSIQPTGGDFFLLGDIAPGETKTLTATGVLGGQPGDTKSFTATAGSMSPNGTSTLGLTYAVGATDILISRSFVATSISFNRSTAEPVFVRAGESLQSLITWENSLSVPVRDVQVVVQFSGSAYDPNGLDAGGGILRGGELIFNKSTHAGLAELFAAASGASSFTLRPKSAGQLAGVNSPSITVRAITTGTRTENGASQTISATTVRTIRIGTEVGLSTALANAGTSPEGTPLYTVALTATNTINSVGGARVVATLGEGLRFAGTGDTGITYDEASRTVTWVVGDLKPSASITTSFPVSVLPGSAIEGTSRILGEQKLTGTDRSTSQGVSATAPALMLNSAR